MLILFLVEKVNDYTHAILVQTHNKLEKFLMKNQEFDESNNIPNKKTIAEQKQKEQNVSKFKKENSLKNKNK